MSELRDFLMTKWSVSLTLERDNDERQHDESLFDVQHISSEVKTWLSDLDYVVSDISIKEQGADHETGDKFVVLDETQAGILLEICEYLIDDTHKSPVLTEASARLSAQHLRDALNDDKKQDSHRFKLQSAHALLDALRAAPVGVDALTPDKYRGADHE